MSGGWAGSNRRDALPPDWPALRAATLKADGYRCTHVDRFGERCGAVATDVDHVIPRWKGGTDDPSNLTSLCSPHHDEKSSAEGHEAKAWRSQAVKRPKPRHPGSVG